MTTQDVADKLVALCKEGKNMDAIEALYSVDIVSVEAFAPQGSSRETKGLEAVIKKSLNFRHTHQVHSSIVEGPLVAGDHFVVRFKVDSTFMPEMRRFDFDELGIYKVQDGKIVYEEFFYSV